VVAERRFAPIIALVFVGLAILLARLFQVQILEHETWAREAQNLVRSGKSVPYHRGRILDREGRVLVKDEDIYQIEFSYRDFRRGHPLGEIAHARSSLEMRAVPLAEALANMEAWACELVEISPRALDDFRRGAGLRTPTFAWPPVAGSDAKAAIEREALASRASDLRYYAGELLHATSAERGDMHKAEKVLGSEASFVALLANVRKTTRDALMNALQSELAAAREHLAFLADLIDRELEPNETNASRSDASGSGRESSASPRETSAGRRDTSASGRESNTNRPRDARSNASHAAADRPPRPEALGELVALLEKNRRRAEDAVADELFLEAAGFDAGRLSSAALTELVDISWIASAMRWDRARTLDWARSRRADWLHELVDDVVPRILMQAAEQRSERGRAGQLLTEIAKLYLPTKDDRRRATEDSRAWTELDELCVFSDIDALFRAPRGAPDERVPDVVLPFQDRDVRAAWRETRESDDPWIVLGAVSELLLDPPSSDDAPRAADPFLPDDFIPPRNASEAAARWRKISENHLHPESDAASSELAWLVLAMERRFASACDRVLRARALDRDGYRPLAFAEDRIAAAREQDKFIQRDRENRPMLFPGTPSYDLVHLLARYADRYRGFDVREATRRVPVAFDSSGRPFARLLVGSVRRPSLSQLFAQAGDLRRLRNLRSKLVRSDDDESELYDINARLYRRDEITGGSGVEAYFDRELRGKYGYREIEGLEQRAEGAAAGLSEPPIDGQDVTLTIDFDLQCAAQNAIEHPDMPRDGLADALWFENPIGAIVLVTPDGEILAAASSPLEHGLPPTPGRDEERTHVRERTLERPTFNPPGSVFKPFVAAYALDRMHFDPHTHFVCGLIGDGKYGYREMHCHGGHGSCDMSIALADSCNAYFAQLGERFKPDELIEMAHMFGFGEPTGILRFSGDDRRGILEHASLRDEDKLAARLAETSHRLRFACGLGFIEATPMQVARATAGLLTGKLPELRIDRRIGDAPTPHAARDLGLSPATQAYIRDALVATITHEKGGTAYDKGLDRASLGFSFACKTGTADTQPFKKTPELTPADRFALEQGKMRKHAWIAGWFPVDDPKAVLVVYLHDVSETASHTAVYVASQFLRSAAVKKFLEGTRANDGASPKSATTDAASTATNANAPRASSSTSATNVSPAPASAIPAPANAKTPNKDAQR
jgi:penicillin-binding protein 2